MSYNYVEFLKQKLHDARTARKPQRTELQIEISVASLLGERPHHSISVDVIADRANIAHGTFYRYFSGKQEVIAKTIADYFAFVRATRPRIHGISDFDATRVGNRHYVRCFRENVGLMRCHFQLKDDDEQIAKVGRQADRELSDRIINRLVRRHKISEDMMPRLRLRTYALIGMVDELLLKIYGQADPPLAGFAEDMDMIADTLTQLWHSALDDFRTNDDFRQDAATVVPIELR